jgi:hypothetical protein
LVPYSVHLLAGMGFHLFSANCGSEWAPSMSTYICNLTASLPTHLDPKWRLYDPLKHS